jgi:hypothetical protein
MTNTTIYQNQSLHGAGVYNGGTWFARNSTISGNSAEHDGGGIVNYGTAYLYSVTVANNHGDAVDSVGGGVDNSAAGSFNVINTLIANNYLSESLVYSDCAGPVTSSGGFRIGYTGGCSISGAYGAVNPGSLGPLAANGGPTMTHALLTGSAAINAAETPSGCVDWNWSQLATDQRGGTRYAGAWCDSGAFEYGASLPRVWVPLIVK